MVQLRHGLIDIGDVGLHDIRGALVGGAIGWGCLFFAVWHSPLPRMLKTPKEQKNEQAATVEVCDRVVAMIHAMISGSFGVYAWVVTPIGSCALPPREDSMLRLGVALTAAFLMYDMGMLLASDVFLRLRPISKAMLVHHVNILLLFFTGLAMHSFTWFMAAMLVNEVSTVPLHVTWFLKEHGQKDTLPFAIFGASLVLSFLVCRVVAITAALIIFLRATGCNEVFTTDNVATAMFWMALVAFIVHWCLNVYWFYKLLLMAGKKSRREEPAAETDALLPGEASRAGMGPPQVSDHEEASPSASDDERM